MTLLKLITESAANNETINSESDYPVVLNPEAGCLNLKPTVEGLDPASLAFSPSGWKVAPFDGGLVDINQRFFRSLKRNFSYTKFSKNEFIQNLNAFLEKIKDHRRNIPVEVDSSDDKYTRVLIEKFGPFLGKDVAGLVLEACISLEIWDLVETLIVNSLVDRSSYSNLILRLVVKRRSDLLCLCIKHAWDLGSTELLCILKYFLCPPKDAYSTIMSVKSEWESQAMYIIGRPLTFRNSPEAQNASILLMVAYDEFLPSELCLHFLLASSNIDEHVLSFAISKLNGEEMGSLIDYLLKWLKKFERFPQAVPCPKASTLGLHICDWVPKLEDVVKFLGLVLDENYLSLLLHSEFHEKLRVIAETVSSLATDAKFCSSLSYLIDNL